MKKLTLEQEEKLNSFIGKCVRKNVQMGVLSNKIGTNISLDIQELYNSNSSTLLTFGQKLEKLENENGGRFSKKGPYLIGGIISATEMMDIIELIVTEKEYNDYVTKQRDTITRLQRDLDSLKSESEIRAEKSIQLAELQAKFKAEVGE